MSEVGYVSFGWAREGDHEIKVEVREKKWYTIHLIDGKPDDDIAGMLGSHELPTPWGDNVDKDTVVKLLKERNPHCIIK